MRQPHKLFCLKKPTYSGLKKIKKHIMPFQGESFSSYESISVHPPKRHKKAESVDDLFQKLADANRIFWMHYHVLDLAWDLVRRGCRVPTALWIAVKYSGIRNYSYAQHISNVTGIGTKQLVEMERQDLKTIEYMVEVL